jgi:hypothetical protein
MKPNNIPIENPIMHMVVSKIGGYAAPFGAPAGAQPLLLQNQIIFL